MIKKVIKYKSFFLNEPHEVSKYISVEKTIEKFGYDPRYCSFSSHREVICICIKCNKTAQTSYVIATKNKNLMCHKCANSTKNIKINASQRMQKYLEKNIPIHKGKLHSKKTKNLMPLSRKGKFTGKNNPMYGKPSPHGKGEWFTKEDGTKVWMRSSWEIKFAKYLNKHKIGWLYEFKVFPITYLYEGKMKEGNYLPDFYLPIFDKYVEVKGYWRDKSKFKFEAFKEQYPNEKIQLVMKEEMKELGLI